LPEVKSAEKFSPPLGLEVKDEGIEPSIELPQSSLLPTSDMPKLEEPLPVAPVVPELPLSSVAPTTQPSGENFGEKTETVAPPDSLEEKKEDLLG
jgi:hypothetical protein